jgi:O-antigen/teichoic acid export membrane protein
MSRLGNQAAVLSMARLANYGLMLLSPMILVRILPVAAFGRYREFLVYTSLLIAFAAFNINDSLLYFIPAHAQSRWRIIQQSTILVACSSFAIVAFAIALDLALKGALIGNFLFPTAIYVLLFVNVDFWESSWLADHRPVPVFLYTTGRLLARMIVVVVAAITTHNIATIVWSLIALESVRLAGSVIAWKVSSKIEDRQPLTNLWRAQLQFCMPWGTAVVLAMTSRNLGNIVVVKLLGTAALAYYTIGLYGEPIIAAIRNSLSTVLLPQMVRQGSSSTEERLRVWRRGIVVNCVILFPLVIVLARYAEPLILRVFGGSYRPSVLVLQIYTLVILRECFDMTLPLRSANRTMPLVQSSVVGLLVNVVCLIFLVPRAGIAGAALSLVAAGFAEAIYLGWCVARVSKISMARLLPWGVIAKVALAAIVAGAVILSNVWTKSMGFFGLALGSVVYMTAFWLLLWLLRVPEAGLLWGWATRALRIGASKSGL